METEEKAKRWPADRQTDRQIKKLDLCKLQRKHLSKGQTSSRDGWYHMHHFCQWALRFEFTYFSIISEVIPATTSHITTCLKLTSVWDKKGVICALSKKFFKHSLHIIIFSIPSSKMQKIFSETCRNSYFYEIIQCTKFAKLWILLENLILVIHNSCRRLFILRLECTGGGWEQ